MQHPEFLFSSPRSKATDALNIKTRFIIIKVNEKDRMLVSSLTGKRKKKYSINVNFCIRKKNNKNN